MCGILVTILKNNTDGTVSSDISVYVEILMLDVFILEISSETSEKSIWSTVVQWQIEIYIKIDLPDNYFQFMFIEVYT